MAAELCGIAADTSMRLLHFVRNDAMFCKCAGYKNRDAKNHRRVARGGAQNTEVARNGLNGLSFNLLSEGV
ncbi:MAG: hypothetical protein COZ75_00845 [Flavobacteriaceae bacterium CG_4_8_14_3_um_filter_34_10]|nr:MAG: hypothetical protein COW66_06835 [Flavobacteriaceae bacterium CG18_big_fil_WC_8_21_14_2_50_34_36]PIV49165.1 MAG: hypothetical protein COS19_10090 [Flavobacteriaceae bacterium CG02_land_8_20_14_3_00_34_13]PIX10592.1 MAG: hypothetical protein COZ75_00845 [Flavobacteriaceae bacterium CG_4_8_14_3_um_filter_34_10]